MGKTFLLSACVLCCLLFTIQSTASTPDSTGFSGKPTWSVLVGTNASIVLPSDRTINVLGAYSQAPRPLQANGIPTPYSRVKAGFTAGIGFSTSLNNSLNPNWTGDFILLFQQKGFSDWSVNPLEKVSTIHLNYVSARQMLKRRFTEKWSFSAGIEESFLVDQRQNFTDTTETSIWNWDFINEFGIEYNRFDFSFLLGADYAPKSIPLVSRLIVGFGIVPIGRGELIFTDELGTELRTVKDRNAFINLSVSYPLYRKT